MLPDGLAAVVLDAVDEAGRDALAAVIEHGIGGGEAERGGFFCAESEGKELGHFFHDAEFFGVLGDLVHTDRLGEAHGDYVARFFQRAAQGERPQIIAVKIFGLPHGQARSLRQFYRGIHDQAGGREAVIKRCQINEGFEGRPHLAPGLGGAVEGA
jgi:hypothetical protein